MTHEEIDEFERTAPRSSKLSEICDLAHTGLQAREAVVRLLNRPVRLQPKETKA